MTNLKSSTLRPGLLVSLKTSLRGGVDYQVREIEADHINEAGERVAAWETSRTISDPEEHERAIKARSKARSIITGVCSASDFGLLCPQANERNLEAAIADARRIADNFNTTATLTKVDVYVITGRVADNDAEAIRAINSELRGLLDTMRDGVRDLDATAIREAANKARALGQMLSTDAQEKVKDAIDAARKVARAIVKAGDSAAVEIDRTTLDSIAAARTAFIDLEPVAAVQAPEAEGHAVDFGTEGQDRESYSDTQDRESYALDIAEDLDIAEPNGGAAPAYDF
jgi:ElaB/YqjD/DUF883 family membrane-anchored ribosome-binding protein